MSHCTIISGSKEEGELRESSPWARLASAWHSALTVLYAIGRKTWVRLWVGSQGRAQVTSGATLSSRLFCFVICPCRFVQHPGAQYHREAKYSSAFSPNRTQPLL